MIVSFTARNLLRIVWVTILITCAVLYIIYSDQLTAKAIFEWIHNNSEAVVITYSLICIIRGVTLIPSTPFIFAGILLFPDSPFMMLGITLGCILFSSIIIYYLSGYMGLGTYFERMHQEKIIKMREKISQNSGFYFITAWALIPFTPTDLLTYVAGSIKLPFGKIMLPLMIGEAIICSVYIFSGAKIIEYFS
jgi:uncharacterized membrane protein YdjX (TVP38/TMEM64 family)